MSKIVATYVVRITLRETNDLVKSGLKITPPTLDELVETIEDTINSVYYTANATAERTDK